MCAARGELDIKMRKGDATEKEKNMRAYSGEGRKGGGGRKTKRKIEYGIEF